MGETLGPTCGPAHLDLCDEAKKKSIMEFTALGAAKREEMIKEKEALLDKAEKDFKLFVESLNQQYKEESEKKDKVIEEINSGGLGLLKSVHSFEKKTAKGEL